MKSIKCGKLASSLRLRDKHRMDFSFCRIFEKGIRELDTDFKSGVQGGGDATRHERPSFLLPSVLSSSSSEESPS